MTIPPLVDTPNQANQLIRNGEVMTVPAGFKGLRFPCKCVSSRSGGYSDPWTEITKNKLLPNGTKEEILNILAQEPSTITQIAETLGLAAPSIHTHVSDMCAANSCVRPSSGRKHIRPSAIMNQTFLFLTQRNARSLLRFVKR